MYHMSKFDSAGLESWFLLSSINRPFLYHISFHFASIKFLLLLLVILLSLQSSKGEFSIAIIFFDADDPQILFFDWSFLFCFPYFSVSSQLGFSSFSWFSPLFLPLVSLVLLVAFPPRWYLKNYWGVRRNDIILATCHSNLQVAQR